MVRGLYSAAAGMLAMSQQQDATAHNLAHADKPGFRREVLRFDAVGRPDELIGPLADLHTDQTAGILEFTGQQLDVAIDGPGFFVVAGPNGPAYTRSGVFQLNANGEIVTPEGFAVQGGGGSISIPPGTTSIEILDDGSVIAAGQVVDQLSLVTFDNPQQLQRIGTSYFAAPAGVRPTQADVFVRQGSRELSNTSSVHEMTQLISGLRQFEATQRALRNIGDSLALVTRPGGR